MECREVRELLPDLALGTLDDDLVRWMDRHLAWCAGCRREAEQLAEGAAAIPLAVGGPVPPSSLEPRVVRAVARAAGRSARGRRLAVVAAALAGVVATVSFAWALTVRGRFGALEDAAAGARAEAQRAANALEEVIGWIAGRPALSATLIPVEGAAAGGRGVVYDSESGPDFAVVIVGGLPASERYHVALVTYAGDVALGRLSETAPGRLSLHRIFRDDISGAKALVVRDARGRDVLRGRLTTDVD